ncbi:hypothetical protein EN816_34190 [Mesorhizobium sp. M8A.F.Ca.ET.173.01.1.1]|nr:hypothetical protein EN816_34190 [Mesorhizobium sp. M8A.F.Ca.ET.173.01.1.1]
MLSVHSVTYLSGSDTGILSPYSDGERNAVIDGFANFQRCKRRRRGCVQFLLPVTIRGEGAGRRMRGGAALT